MYPILFRFPEFLPVIGGRGIHMYGLMIALGFLLGWLYVQRETRRLGLDENKMADFFFYLVLFSMAGSRLMYVIVSVDHFWQDPLVLFRVWEGGLVFQGGILGGLPFVIYYSIKHKFKFFQVADIFSVPLALGHALGRLGCFFAGCCYGKPCGLFPLGVTFPNNPDTVAPIGIALYPTQLMESGAEFLVFAFLLWYRRHKKFDGAVFLMYMMIYAVLRSVIEVYRGDKIRGFIIEPYLSTAQFVSLIGFAAAALTWILLRRHQSQKH